MAEFDKKKITLKWRGHVNGGRAFNYTNYAVLYDGKIIGAAARGREKKETIARYFLGDNVYNLPQDMDAFLLEVQRMVQ